MTLTDGYYIIRNAGVPLNCIDLAGGESKPGTKTQGFRVSASYNANQVWRITPVWGEPETYKIACVASGGTVLELTDTQSTAHAPVVGGYFTNAESQKWVIRLSTHDNKGYFKIQNKASGTFVDLLNGSSANHTAINGWPGSWDSENTHQRWIIDPSFVA